MDREVVLPVGGDPRIAVLVPCYNEAAAIGKVVRELRQALPTAIVYVYDNNSTDGTAAVAHAAGALVRHETRQGKGYVVRRMFADIEADVFVIIDGDDTYDASAAPELVQKLVVEGLDVVNAVRVENMGEAYRRGHRFGNRMLSSLVRGVFGDGFSDMLSGYRVLSRRFVKSFPLISTGFEIETELAIHALELKMPTAEVRTPFGERPAGSASKLRTFGDGYRILLTILRLVKQERPIAFFGSLGVVCGVISLGLALPVIMEYMATGLVPRLPTAVLAGITMLLAFLCLGCGLILETVTRGRQEAKRMRYLAERGILGALAARADPQPEIRDGLPAGYVE